MGFGTVLGFFGRGSLLSAVCLLLLVHFLLIFLFGWFLWRSLFCLLELVERGGASSVDEIEELDMVVVGGAA